MVFGKIDYINLLPFYVFVKKKGFFYTLKRTMSRKKSPPSLINKKMRLRQIDGGFISSVESFSQRYVCLDAGIVAKKMVKSVILKKGLPKEDPASATSNALAKILGLRGEVFIGDRALYLYLNDENENENDENENDENENENDENENDENENENDEKYIDLAKVWNEKTNLPFVFARLCINKKFNNFDKLIEQFLKSKIKIPRYILKHQSIQKKISQADIIDYLKLINYKIEFKEKKALSKFHKKWKNLRCANQNLS